MTKEERDAARAERQRKEKELYELLPYTGLGTSKGAVSFHKGTSNFCELIVYDDAGSRVRESVYIDFDLTELRTFIARLVKRYNYRVQQLGEIKVELLADVDLLKEP